MQIRMAHAAGHHLDQNLSRTRHRHGHVFYHQWLAELAYDCSLHHFSHFAELHCRCGWIRYVARARVDPDQVERWIAVQCCDDDAASLSRRQLSEKGNTRCLSTLSISSVRRESF